MENEMMNILKDIQQDIKDIRQDIELVKTQQKEHTELLKSLEHSAEGHKAQIENLSFTVARAEGEVKAKREDLNAVERITSKNWNDIVKLKAVK